MNTALIGAVTAILIVAWAIYALGALKLNQAAIETGMLSEQADTVRRIFELFVIDGYSLSVIAQILNEEGVETQCGGQWYPATVRYILNNGFFAGLMQYEDWRAC